MKAYYDLQLPNDLVPGKYSLAATIEPEIDARLSNISSAKFGEFFIVQ